MGKIQELLTLHCKTQNEAEKCISTVSQLFHLYDSHMKMGWQCISTGNYFWAMFLFLKSDIFPENPKPMEGFEEALICQLHKIYS